MSWEKLMTRWWIALGSVGAFTVLAVAVHVGLLDRVRLDRP